ncbi:alpha/beta hydrolase family protein [Hymenobacter sp. DG25B]|uniref:alpha/beta hydrolase family protein n=1 Tax=Hymenobacter sp. DG25B TaxID=1385664 RepID=UPI0012E03AC9|nr:hypothetical protein [Hymenobacter sp. DG25B]
MPVNGFVSFPRLLSWAAQGRALAVGCLLLTACSGKSGKPALPLPTGHFEGPVTIQGTELRAALDLREVAPGKLQAELSFPAVPGMEVPLNEVHYTEPQLHFEQQGGFPGHVTVNAIREGDFLRGSFLLDSLRAEFVWVRRGPAAPRQYQEQAVRLQAGNQRQIATLYLPEDTVARHPVMVVLPDSVTSAVGPARAAWLARQGVASLLLAPAASKNAPTDSSARQWVEAAFSALRTTPTIDTARVALWVRGTAATQVVKSVARPRPVGIILEAVPLASAAEAQAYKALSRQRIPTLALYAGADDAVDARQSARRLRNAIGYGRGNAVQVYLKANAYFLLPGSTNTAGLWSWPYFAPGYVQDVEQWLQQRLIK